MNGDSIALIIMVGAILSRVIYQVWRVYHIRPTKEQQAISIVKSIRYSVEKKRESGYWNQQ